MPDFGAIPGTGAPGEEVDDLTAALTDSVKGFLRSETNINALDNSEIVWQGLVEAGWLGIIMPVAFGGSELPAAALAELAKEMARGLLNVGFTEVAGLALPALALCPSSPLRDHLGAAALAGKALPVLAWQEHDADEMRLPDCSVCRTTDGIVLSGVKRFVDHPGRATHFLVTATFEGNAVLVLLPKETQGLTITQHPAISGGALGTLSFDKIFLPGESILSERPQGWLAPAFRLARIAAAAELTGLATWALDTTIAYAGTRVQFDKAILANQAVRHQLVDMWIQLQLAQAALRRAADSHASDDGNAYRDSLAAKIRSSDAADLICRKAIQFHGAIGYTAEYPLGGVIRRSLALNAWLGTPTALRRRYVLDISRQELTHG